MANLSPSIPLLDLTRYLETDAQALKQAFERVLHSGHYIMGQDVANFEAACATYCHLPDAACAVGVSSGTDALLMALMALEIGPNTDVICPTYSFFATAGSIHRVGARPVFVDHCPGCFNMLPSQVSDVATPHTKAIMPVHLFGQMADMPAIVAIAQRLQLYVIEDAAQAFGASIGAQQAGTIGDIGCFSFFPSKILGALGDAGMLFTKTAAWQKSLRGLRNHGSQKKYYHDVVGGNFRIDTLQAAFLTIKLSHVDAAIAARQHCAHLYHTLFLESGLAQIGTCICDGRVLPPMDAPVVLPVAQQSGHTYNQYVIRVRHGMRDSMRAFLQENNIGTEIYYPLPLHQQVCFAHLNYHAGQFPYSNAAAQETLALPIFPGLQEGEIACVVQAIVQFIGQQKRV